MDGGGKKHFILVHGLCHGAWCWYKVATLLRAAGHRVTALDLAASGAHPARLDEVRSFEEYSRPLLDAVAAAAPPGGDERLILVGHSHGGLSIALAMERFPRKVAAAVFAAALMPCVGKHMGVTTEEFMRRTASKGLLMDCQMVPIDSSSNGNNGVAIVIGPKFMEEKFYQQSPVEDLTLAKLLVRPGNQFVEDPVMKDAALLTAGNYGSVRKVYVVAKADGSSTEEMQRWMVDMSPGTEVEEIAGADHAVMSSKPTELCDVATLLSSAGHRVTALDMAACGARPERAEEVASFEEYSRPLLDAVAALPPGEQAVLVGHSFGGQSLALAMERYPDRVAVAVFASAAMPALGKPMAFVLEEFSQETGPDFYMDCAYGASSNPRYPVETLLLGPEYLAKRLYQLSPPEDLTLAMAMVRPSQWFVDDAVLKGNNLTAEGYGAVRRVCVVAEDDASWSAEFQRRMASWNPGSEVRGLKGADHMLMLSKPRELSELLVEIADKYC